MSGRLIFLLLLILTLSSVHNAYFVHSSRRYSGESWSESSEKPLRAALANAKAVDSGVTDADELFEAIEPSLYAQDLIPENHPPAHLPAANLLQVYRVKGKELSRYAYASLRATLFLQEQLAQFSDDNGKVQQLSDFLLKHTKLRSSACAITSPSINCESEDSMRIYRRADGVCNNLKNSSWGSSFQSFVRYLPQEYDDGVSTIRKSVSGNELPSPRKISAHIHNYTSRASDTHAMMLIQWGQFIIYDLAMAAQSRAFNFSVPKCCRVPNSHPACLPIPSPLDDPVYNGTTDCLEFVRSSPSPRRDCRLGAREQLNQLTSWLDGSNIYGSTEEELRDLRLFQRGKLKAYQVPNSKPLLPRPQRPDSRECILSFPRLQCFSSGAARANEEPEFPLHSIWLRQHNLIAEKMAVMNPQWSEESMFQETRKIVTAQLQHITFREFLPLVLGPSAVKTFGLRVLRTGYHNGYNDSVDGTVPNAFGAAAFTFGQSMVRANLQRSDNSQQELPHRKELGTDSRPSGGVDQIALGIASQRSQNHDEFVSAERTNPLFKSQAQKEQDTASINIQRGRDHGLAPYIKWREACGLLKPLKHNGPLITWDDFAEATGLEQSKVKLLMRVYENPWDVDLFAGGMLELPVRGGVVGPSFACIVGQTFRNLRRGDRFWYENPGQFTPSQLQAIRNVSLARVLCDTSNAIPSIQPVVFLSPQLQRNPNALCSDFEAIPQMSFSPWNQVSPSEAAYTKYKNPVTGHSKPVFYSLSYNYWLNGEEDSHGESSATIDEEFPLPSF